LLGKAVVGGRKRGGQDMDTSAKLGWETEETGEYAQETTIYHETTLIIGGRREGRGR